MQSSDRYHALDAVRGIALLLGVALHAAQPYIAGLPWMAPEPPSTTLAGVWYTIHMFRLPVFFLIAGFFGRMMLERRGMTGFIKDRSRRILVPLVIGVPVIMLITGAAYVLGAFASGVDLRTLQGLHPPPSPVHRSALGSINLIHLWFLYYLILFYLGALMLRSIVVGFGRGAGTPLSDPVDRGMKILTSNVCGPLLLALPITAYYVQAKFWSPWGGLPGPMSIIPDDGALLAYAVFFGFGWLLHRQPELLGEVQKRWILNCTIAVLAWSVCRVIAGSTPHWGPFLKGGVLLTYTGSYMIAAWSGCLGLVGIAMQYLSGFSLARRYLADSSYWIYLMHIPVLLFFEELLHPLHWHWSLKYMTCLAGAMPILFLSYHYLVRFTFIGATLNGRRRPRAGARAVGAPAPG